MSSSAYRPFTQPAAPLTAPYLLLQPSSVDLSLEEAATRLGKSVRQVRYLIKNGQLTATKIGGRWVIDDAALPLSPAQRQHTHRKLDRIEQKAEATLAPETVAEQPAPVYSVRRLRAFEVGRPLFYELNKIWGAEHPAAQHLAEALALLTIGAHRFGRAHKAEAYQAARH